VAPRRHLFTIDKDDAMDLRSPTGRALALAAMVALMAPATARASDIKVRGLLDVVAAPRGDAFEGNILTRDDCPFDAYGARVFGDAQVDPRLLVSVQVMLHDASSIYVDGAYAIFTPSPQHDLHVLAGKIPWPIGTYAPRTYSNHNPLIGTPLMYQYHSTLLWYELVPSADALIATSGSGQSGVNYFGYAEGHGMTLIDDSFWDVGVTAVGSARPWEYALGVTAGTPGWGSTAQEENSGKTVLGRVGVTPLAGVRLGISGAYGPYLDHSVEPGLPAGHQVEDYHQQLAMADVEVVAGHVEGRAEGAYNVWQTPTVGDLNVQSGYAELKYAFSFGGYLAGRWDGMWFGRIADSSGTVHPCDGNLTRLETGAGYRFSRAAQGKLVYQLTRYEQTPSTGRPRDRSLVAAQLSIAF